MRGNSIPIEKSRTWILRLFLQLHLQTSVG